MVTRAILTNIAPQFVVLDVVKTAEYYRDVLGFTILGYFLDPPVFAMVARNEVEIHFCKADSLQIQVNEAVRRGLGTDAYILCRIWTPCIRSCWKAVRKLLKGRCGAFTTEWRSQSRTATVFNLFSENDLN